MSYRIEFLKEPTEEDSVCHAFMSREDDLLAVEREAFSYAEQAKEQYGAAGFQIRHLNAVDKVVAIASFDDEIIAENRDPFP